MAFPCASHSSSSGRSFRRRSDVRIVSWERTGKVVFGYTTVDLRSWEKRGLCRVVVREFKWERRRESVVRRFSLDY